MFSSRPFVAALAAAMVVCTSAQAAAVLDQINQPGRGVLNESVEWQQEVTAGVSGQLAGITLYGAATDLLVRIAQGDAFYSGAYAFSQTTSLAADGVFIDTSAANIMLTAGQHFVIDLSQGSGGNIFFLASPYAGGHFFLKDGTVTDFTGAYGYSLAFQTFMDSGGAVPEPSTWALLLMGFGGLGAVLRRRRSPVIAA